MVKVRVEVWFKVRVHIQVNVWVKVQVKDFGGGVVPPSLSTTTQAGSSGGTPLAVTQEDCLVFVLFVGNTSCTPEISLMYMTVLSS